MCHVFLLTLCLFCTHRLDIFPFGRMIERERKKRKQSNGEGQREIVKEKKTLGRKSSAKTKPERNHHQGQDVISFSSLLSTPCHISSSFSVIFDPSLTILIRFHHNYFRTKFFFPNQGPFSKTNLFRFIR